MAVVITSTTSSQAELDHATSENWRSSEALDEFKAKAAEAEAPAKEPEVAEVEPAIEPKEADAAEPEAPKAEPKPKHKGGVDKQIGNLTKKWREEERQRKEIETQRDAERAEKEALRKELAIARGEIPEEIPETEPVFEEYQAAGKNLQEYLRDRDAYRDNQKVRAQQVEAYNKAMELAVKKYPDWNEAARKANESGVQFSKNVEKALLKAIGEESNPADILYYIWTHTDDARKFVTGTPEQATKWVGRIAERLSTQNAAPAATSKPKAVPPPPIEPVTNAASRGNLSIFDKDVPFSVFKRERDKHERDLKRNR